MEKKKYRMALLVISLLMMLAGCKAHKQATKYGAPPVTKYGIIPTSYIFQPSPTPTQKT